ncbi:beta-lactamase family protein [Ruminococcaceae bacterium OttesenSCG-928-A11]|nr:beta-lactamase family protein [Ruminococcaceae bacterium OttesenSCG-928-A11]
MPLGTQVKMMRAMREILMGDSRNALPAGSSPKPDFAPLHKSIPLPRATPEETGLPSAALERFYRAVAAIPQCNAHALMVVHRGHVVSEGYFAPFRKGVWHVTHSLCKTFTGTAVAFAIEEGLFGLDDPVARFFPEAGRFVSKRHKAITVRHLLCMQSGITFNEISQAAQGDWLKGIFSSPVAFEPGSAFVYNSMNSYLLSALVCKTSGMGLVDYLTPRLFEPLGFGPVAWEKSPEGYEKGGWGMYILLEDMAKFGQLYLQDGKWETGGRMAQVLPVGWVATATQMQTQSDRELGYGCHCWVDAADTGYTMNGMFGQYITVFPRQQMVIVMNAGSPRLLANSAAYDAFNGFVSALGELPETLPPAPGAFSALARTLAGLKFRQAAPGTTPPKPLPRGKRPPRAQRWAAAGPAAAGAGQSALDAFCGTTWRFGKNKGGILPVIAQVMNNNLSAGVRALHLRRQPQKLTLLWEEGDVTFAVPIGIEGRYEECRLQVGEENFLAAAAAKIAQDEDGEDVLVIELCLLEYSSFRRIKLSRRGENLLLRLDEEPSLEAAIAAAAAQDDANQANPKKASAGFGDVVLQNEYTQYRLDQLCTPRLLGRPVQHQ